MWLVFALQLSACKTPDAARGVASVTRGGPPDPGCIVLPTGLPPALDVGPTLVPAIQVWARGTQRYTCVSAANGTGAAWSAAVPDAVLYQCGADGGEVGTHFAGPTWKWTADSSTFVGSKAAGFVSVPSPEDAGFDIPWLRLPRGGGSDGGVLGPIRFVQRVETRGGLVTHQAAACDSRAADAGLVVSVPYSATYIFYRGGD
jgi:Protein of unknown function (DUF3455)